jgi:hypothetical protein
MVGEVEVEEEGGGRQERRAGVDTMNSSAVVVTEPPREGIRRQDQLERFSAKQEHNQDT